MFALASIATQFGQRRQATEANGWLFLVVALGGCKLNVVLREPAGGHRRRGSLNGETVIPVTYGDKIVISRDAFALLARREGVEPQPSDPSSGRDERCAEQRIRRSRPSAVRPVFTCPKDRIRQDPRETDKHGRQLECALATYRQNVDRRLSRRASASATGSLFGRCSSDRRS
jgi:hypothetical protein